MSVKRPKKNVEDKESSYKKEPNDLDNITSLVLSSGGIRGSIMLGVLHYIIDRYPHFLENIHTYCGTSIGGIISYLLIIGYSPSELLSELIERDVTKAFKLPNLITLLSVKGYENGLFSYSILEKHLRELTLKKLHLIPTLEELHELTGKTLILCTYRCHCPSPSLSNEDKESEDTKEEVVYLSPTTTPTLDCITALKMTSNIPYVFPKFIYENYEYIDGGIADSFPIKHIEEYLESLGLMKGKILGINFQKASFSNKKNLLESLFCMVQVPMRALERYRISLCNKENVKIISLPTKDIKDVSLSSSIKDIVNMFSLGYNYMKIISHKEDESNKVKKD